MSELTKMRKDRQNSVISADSVAAQKLSTELSEGTKFVRAHSDLDFFSDLLFAPDPFAVGDFLHDVHLSISPQSLLFKRSTTITHQFFAYFWGHQK